MIIPSEVRGLFHAFLETPFSLFMRRSSWGVAAAEVLHLLGLASLGGAVLTLNLGSLGVGLRASPSTLAQATLPVWACGLAVMITSGIAIVGSAPLHYAVNTAFWVKMALLASALLSQGGLYLLIGRTLAKTAWKPLAAIALILWLGVGLAGRAIGFI